MIIFLFYFLFFTFYNSLHLSCMIGALITCIFCGFPPTHSSNKPPKLRRLQQHFFIYILPIKLWYKHSIYWEGNPLWVTPPRSLFQPPLFRPSTVREIAATDLSHTYSNYQLKIMLHLSPTLWRNTVSFIITCHIMCHMTLCPWARHFALLASEGMSLYLL